MIDRVDRLLPSELLSGVLSETAYVQEIEGVGRRQARENLKKLGARKIAAAGSSDVQAWVTERSQASSPGTVRLLVQTALSLQMLASKIV